MDIKLRIGQVADLLGITPKTIRHYHKLGLLPVPERQDNGYRVYRVQSLYRINLIKSLKRIGFSLGDIQQIMDADSPDEQLHQELRRMKQAVDTQIADLQSRQDLIQGLISKEATLDETQQPEFPVIIDMMPPSFLDNLNTLSPQMLSLEKSLYEQLDSFQWGAEYEELLQKLGTFLAENPEIVQALETAFERAKHLAPDDETLHTLAIQLAEKIDGTPLHNLLLKSSFAQDKSVFQSFLSVSEDTISDGLTPSQKQLLTLIDDNLSQ